MFVGKDVAEVLGYNNTRDALSRHVDEDDKGVSGITTPSGEQVMTIINESGLYSLVLSSKLPSAKDFKRWVTREVLPSIRKHGAYMTPETIEKALLDPDTIIKLATELKNERVKSQALAADNEVMKPKALFADAVSVSSTDILVGELAKILKQNGVQIGQNRMFIWLREHGYLISRKGAGYNTPTQRAMELGLFRIKETAITHSDGRITISTTTKVTGRGQRYFVDKLLNDRVLKVVERQH